MRLMIIWPDFQTACAIQERMEQYGWEAEIRQDGRCLAEALDDVDIVLLHLCLSGKDGASAGSAYAAGRPLCTPRILFAAPAEWCHQRPVWADCTVDAGVSVKHLCRLLLLLSQKPLSKLAHAQQQPLHCLAERLLDELSMPKELKGRACVLWLLKRMTPATPSSLPVMGQLYAECARACGTTPAAVERCVRTAVEHVFTYGNLNAIERLFGATVDPERGKPTNRAFLLQAAQQLRYSLTATRSLNSSEMHHSPAAPTSV